MSDKSKKTVGWGFRLLAVFITVVVSAGVFTYAFSGGKAEIESMFYAAIPVVGALIVSSLLGSISAISHKRWHIYVSVLLILAVLICLKLARLI